MGALILHHRGSLAASPYDRWLADYDGDVVLLASRQHLELVGEELPSGDTGYRQLEALPDYEAGGRVEARALELARRYRLDRIIACQEQDLERAAQLREILGLPGQRLSSVLVFRDKVMMKDAARAAGIPVAAYRDVECAVDIIAFAAEHGFPIVVKPRDSAASIDVAILHTPEALDGYLDRAELSGRYRPNLMVESFVPGPMCHIDGLVIGGRVIFAWPSQYLFVEADFAEDHRGRLDVTLDPDDPLTARLLDFADRLLDALPGPDNFAFHAEVFHTPDDRLVLCEIACRTGGTAIRQILRTLFGVDANEAWVRAELGLPVPIVLDRTPLRPSTMAGQLSVTRRPGTVLAVPGRPPFPWIEQAAVFVRAGQTINRAAFSSDLMASFVVAGSDRELVERRLRRVETWFLSGLVIDGSSGADRTVGRAAS